MTCYNSRWLHILTKTQNGVDATARSCWDAIRGAVLGRIRHALGRGVVAPCG